ncbi:hypothetical protein AG0111_0g5602 [Alternaria gaisen]|uniref:Uncharacterized protein n=1 Tax=Alternaria gaisen TaxID=167740 RepID=A0ACB6FMR7_9PLEO|nr:hypothetical protein AG0111_0g5602 [Alternaria gaisen]
MQENRLAAAAPILLLHVIRKSIATTLLVRAWADEAAAEHTPLAPPAPEKNTVTSRISTIHHHKNTYPGNMPPPAPPSQLPSPANPERSATATRSEANR